MAEMNVETTKMKTPALAAPRAPGRRLLWAACLAVLVPLAVLLACQYRWLVTLEETSSIARLTQLGNYADAVVQQIEYTYMKRAERSLNVPGYLFNENCSADLAEYFGRKQNADVRRFFMVNFIDEFRGTLLFYSDEAKGMVAAGDDPEAQAAFLATADWQAGPERDHDLHLSHLDPEHPVIYRTVYDQKGETRLVGLAGLIFDRTHFEDVLLPAAIADSLPKLAGRDQLVALIYDAEGRLVSGGADGPPIVERELSFAFPGWRVGLGGPYASPDADAMRQALSNLFDNAVKYAGQEDPDIEVRLRHAGDEVLLEVADRGIGIAPDERERIFERFHRVGTGLVHDVKGSGLGLAIVRHIVDAHGGRVTLESELGRGSKFTIHLPVAETVSGKATAKNPIPVIAGSPELEAG